MRSLVALLALAACFDPGDRKAGDGDPSPQDDDSSSDSPSDSGTDTDTDTAATDSAGTETGLDTAEDTSSDTSAPVDLTLLRVEPATGSTAGGETVALYGGPFDASATAWFGTSQAGIQSWTNDTLTVTTPAASNEGAVDVSVTTDAGSASLAGGFTYVEPCDGARFDPGSYEVTFDGSYHTLSAPLVGCATGVSVSLDYPYDSSFQYEYVFTSIPSEIDGSATATVSYTTGNRCDCSFVLKLASDQGEISLTIDAHP